MKIRIEDTVYEGTGTEIMDQLRKAAFDPTEFPDTESYIWQLRSNFIRMTDQDCPLPDRGVEAQAQTMIMALAKIGALEVLDHTKTHGQTKGKSGSYSTNFQMSGRELLTPDEVRALDNRYCILFIRGAKPVMDLKYELTEHPAIRYTADGGGAPYIHHGHNTTPAIPGTPFFQVISADETNKEKETAA